MIIPTDSGLTYGRGYVYRIQYHIIWCVKYRRQVLKGSIENDLKKDLLTTANAMGVITSAGNDRKVKDEGRNWKRQRDDAVICA